MIIYIIVNIKHVDAEQYAKAAVTENGCRLRARADELAEVAAEW